VPVSRSAPVERSKASASSATHDRRAARKASLDRAAEQAGSIEEQATLERTALLEARGGFGERLAAREASPILERAALRAGVARELLAREPALAHDFVLQATAARGELSEMRSELAELPEGVSSEELERAALAAEGVLRTAVGREAIAEEGTPAFTEADLEKIGSGLDPTKPPPQTFWREDLVNTICDLGLKQGGLSIEQANRNGDLVRSLLNPDGQVDLQGKPGAGTDGSGGGAQDVGRLSRAHRSQPGRGGDPPRQHRHHGRGAARQAAQGPGQLPHPGADGASAALAEP
jgi:hypothetical protein